MASWQRRTRFALLVAVVAIVVAVAAMFERRPTGGVSEPITPTDPAALVESASGWKFRTNREHEEVRIEYQTLTAYKDNSAKLSGVKITTVRAGGRTYVVTGKQADLAQDETNFSIDGDVRIVSSDGMEVRTEHASYNDQDAVIRAPGPVEFVRGRLSGSGLGATYAKNTDVLTINDRAVMRLSADAQGEGAADFSAGSVEFSRNDHVVRLNGGMSVTRSGQTLEADTGVAHLAADEQRVEAVELRSNARVTTDAAGAGGLKGMRARDIDLTYGPDGRTLERAVLDGTAEVEVAGERQQAARTIAASHLDVTLDPVGSMPRRLAAREAVQLNIPAERGAPARTILARTLDGTGEPGRGLTRARFVGDVQFRERAQGLNRTARSAVLTLTLKQGLSEIDDARFEQGVRFEDGELTATAAQARYALGAGTLELSGSEPAARTPRVENTRISVGASRIEVTLQGPIVVASGSVKSELKPARGAAPAGPGAAQARVPSMFKQDQLVAGTAAELRYEGDKSKATYSGSAQIWQGDTSIKASTIVLDEASGDLTATGPVVTAITLEQQGKDKKRERVHSTGTSTSFAYEEASRRATYSGDAHMNGPQGDMAAAKIELYLKPSGDELDRAEAYDAVTLRDQNRETTGARMTYFSADERYVVTGAPVTITDECARVTTGRTVTFNKTADTVVVDGNQQMRTATRGGANCPSR